ncbi:MAG TPA: SRPBCC family protein [Woeseiaceae bacterium]|nr:SRPBCC family protein [Woeseiaceae bacterium]
MNNRQIIAAARRVLQFFLGGLILATGAGKALDIHGFVSVLQTYRLGLDETALYIAAPGVSILEIALGVWILRGWQLKHVMGVAIALNTGYFLLLMSALMRGLELPNCGCFGVFFARPLRWYSPLEDLGLIALSLLLLGLATDAVRAKASIVIRAPAEKVAAIYRDFNKWSHLFPAVRAAQLRRAGPDWQVIDIDHRHDGTVINLLGLLSPFEIELTEFNRRYKGRFVNRFQPLQQGTRYTVEAEIRPNGLRKLLSGPWLRGYIKNRLTELVLVPVKRAAENDAA